MFVQQRSAKIDFISPRKRLFFDELLASRIHQVTEVEKLK